MTGPTVTTFAGHEPRTQTAPMSQEEWLRDALTDATRTVRGAGFAAVLQTAINALATAEGDEPAVGPGARAIMADHAARIPARNLHAALGIAQAVLDAEVQLARTRAGGEAE